MQPVRRRAPGWVRAMPSTPLHSLAGRLLRGFEEDALTDRQDWLYGCVVNELEYRRRHALRAGGALRACHCWFCLPLDEWSEQTLLHSPR